ncbi:hypothetical protein J2S00_001455 [Caldalkalibacillus uzonensis]|uniref:Uncharacterized protein n=1 Tax=Caldalkalibacillus uzonensis TaxID=353224 RepID=A0ABU0CQL3_9BACI|nr:hypothetical protein [Caldalkalibacillus uzonensis]
MQFERTSLGGDVGLVGAAALVKYYGEVNNIWV